MNPVPVRQTAGLRYLPDDASADPVWRPHQTGGVARAGPGALGWNQPNVRILQWRLTGGGYPGQMWTWARARAEVVPELTNSA